MNSGKWTFAAIGYMCLFAYAVSLMIYQFGLLAQGIFTPWTAVAIAVLLVMLYMLFRRNKNALTD
jgi:ferrous iron transport protein B